jgi:hypothetical protein
LSVRVVSSFFFNESVSFVQKRLLSTEGSPWRPSLSLTASRDGGNVQTRHLASGSSSGMYYSHFVPPMLISDILRSQILAHNSVSILLFPHQVLAPRGSLHLGTAAGPEGHASCIRIQDAVGKFALAPLRRRRPRPDVVSPQPARGNVGWVWVTWCVVVV